MLGWTLKREEGVRVRQRRWLSASQAGRSCQYVSCHGPLSLLAPPKSSWPSHLPLVSQSPADSLVALVSAVYVLQSRPSSEGSPTRRPATWTRPPIRHRVKDGTRLRKQTPLSTRAGLIAPFEGRLVRSSDCDFDHHYRCSFDIAPHRPASFLNLATSLTVHHCSP
jgi:hypothetical protein